MISNSGSLSKSFLRASVAASLLVGSTLSIFGQSVGLPAPRLLTTMPMGGKAGTEVEVKITGENLDDAGDLIFSDNRITSKPKLDAAGKRVADTYVVTIAKDCPTGLVEARLMTRLGISSMRVFAIDKLAEVLETKPNTTLETAIDIPLNSISNGTVADRAVDFLRFEAKKGQRVIVDCATRGIDSKLNPTVIIADDTGRDLMVERRGGVLDFQVPHDGKFIVKIHELTFKGGPDYYYRLGVWEQLAGTPIVRQASTSPVNAFSWPPVGLAAQAKTPEIEPNGDSAHVQKITLPCDIAGNFAPAADVDLFEFDAKKGETWWIEVASERFGRPTDPAVLVQRVVTDKNGETLTDVLELTDIPSPVKVSSNGYAYDGPPYNAGTSDVLGQLEIKEDGKYRVRISDLFGGTRNDPGNIYRLVIRKAEPDFALVGWALHMELRNGDRNALSKPISLRGGGTMALEVVAFRRDGFNGDIELSMEDLPEGVTATGLKIPAGQSHGLMLVTANEKAPRGYKNARFVGRSTIDGKPVVRPCHLASVAWPIPDSWGEIPSPRLVADIPVSVSGVDLAPVTITAKTPKIEAKAGEKITIPVTRKKRSEFSGDKVSLKAIGAGFERAPALELSFKEEESKVVIDLATLKTPPGEYMISFVGGAVVKYRHHPETVEAVEATVQKTTKEVAELQAEEKKIAQESQSVPDMQKPEVLKTLAACKAKLKTASDKLKAGQEELKKATSEAAPKDIADIIVCEPIIIHVKPAESK